MSRAIRFCGALACAFAALLSASPALGQADDGSEASLIVATKPLEPFVFADGSDDAPTGYSIDVWDEIGTRLGIETTYVVEETVGDILESARTGDADVAIAGISMTAEREGFIDFTHPYFDAGLQIAVGESSGRSTLQSMIDLLTSSAVVVPVLILLVLITIISHAVWFSERRDNPQFPREYRKGIGEALWWSSVSVVTGGEAVKDINRPASRLLALFWMVVGLVLLAYVTAQAAASLTVQELQSDIAGPDDLAGRTVVTVDGTVAADILGARGVGFDAVADLDTALEQLADGDAAAVVFDSPVLAFRLAGGQSGLKLVGPVFAPDPYAIALTQGSPWREPINAALLEMSRDGTLDDLHTKWFDTER